MQILDYEFRYAMPDGLYGSIEHWMREYYEPGYAARDWEELEHAARLMLSDVSEILAMPCGHTEAAWRVRFQQWLRGEEI